MFAVLKTGGKQYKVAKGDMFTVEKLAAEAGENVRFADILMIGGEKVTIGSPFIKDAVVLAEIVEQTRSATTIHYVKRRRKHSSQRKKGHRQHLTLVRVTDILASGAGKSDVKAATGAAIARAEAHGAAAADAKPAAKAAAKSAAKPAAKKEAAPKPAADKAAAAKPAKKAVKAAKTAE
jgi:large subunit ribosomal protein L21